MVVYEEVAIEVPLSEQQGSWELLSLKEEQVVV